MRQKRNNDMNCMPNKEMVKSGTFRLGSEFKEVTGL